MSCPFSKLDKVYNVCVCVCVGCVYVCVGGYYFWHKFIKLLFSITGMNCIQLNYWWHLCDLQVQINLWPSSPMSIFYNWDYTLFVLVAKFQYYQIPLIAVMYKSIVIPILQEFPSDLGALHLPNQPLYFNFSLHTRFLLPLIYFHLLDWFKILKGCGMGPQLVLISPCFRENVVATCKIGSFLCSLNNSLQSNFKMALIWKRAIFDLLFIFLVTRESYKNSFSTHLTHIHPHILLTLLTFLPYQFWKKYKFIRYGFSLVWVLVLIFIRAILEQSINI